MAEGCYERKQHAGGGGEEGGGGLGSW